MDFGLCQPSLAILLVSIAGVIYHTAMGNFNAVTWWTVAGLAGTGVFQALCFGGLEPVAWVLMSIPVLIVCFFLAVALFASRMRINNVMSVPCDRCGSKIPQDGHCGCGAGGSGDPDAKPRCNRTRCGSCNGCGCQKCLYQLQQAQLNTGLLYNETGHVDSADYPDARAPPANTMDDSTE
jgi:hypothetical protein